jgi:hypothetical protein
LNFALSENGIILSKSFASKLKLTRASRKIRHPVTPKPSPFHEKSVSLNPQLLENPLANESRKIAPRRYLWFIPKKPGVGVEPPRHGEISPQIPSFSTFAQLC